MSVVAITVAPGASVIDKAAAHAPVVVNGRWWKGRHSRFPSIAANLTQILACLNFLIDTKLSMKPSKPLDPDMYDIVIAAVIPALKLTVTLVGTTIDLDSSLGGKCQPFSLLGAGDNKNMGMVL